MNLISENPSGKKEISKIDTILKLKKKRDKVKQSQLIEKGWKIINVWECEIKDKKSQICSKLKDIAQ